MENTTFEVLYKDKVTAEVEIQGNKTHIKRYDTCPMHYLFPFEKMDTYGVLEIHWSRTETYESLMTYIAMDFDGLRQLIVDMLGGQRCSI